MIIGNATVLGVGVAGVIYSTYEKKAPTPIEPIIPMPSDLLNIDENNYVRGFVEGFDKDDPKWKAYNAIEIPKNAEGYLSVFAFTKCKHTRIYQETCFKYRWQWCIKNEYSIFN